MSMQLELKENVDNASLEEVAHQIMNDVSFKTFRDTQEIFYYNNGVYIPGGDTVIKEKCQKRISNCKISQRREIIEIIKIETYTEREQFDNHPDLLNVKNGLVNLKTGQLEPHRPDILSLIQFEVAFDAKAKCPQITKFMNTTISDPKERVSAYEMLASVILPEINLQKAYFFIGKGSNGKSTFLDLTENLVGKNNISTVSLRDLTEDRYATAELYGKVANIHADIEDTEIKHLKDFKLIVTRETIRAQRKFGQPFNFKPSCKVFYSANIPPEIHDKSNATYRRIFPIEFIVQFKENPSKKDLENGVLPSNSEFIKSLFSKTEISGLLNVLIKIAKRIQQRQKFTFPPTIEQVREFWDKKAVPVNDFVNERLVIDKSAWIPKDEMYSEFTNFCTEKNLSVMGENKFSKKLQQSEAPVIDIKKRGIHCWGGVWWKGVSKPEDMSDLRKRKTLNHTL